LTLRRKHFSRRTETAYVAWVVRYVRFCKLRHPKDCGPSDVRDFMDSLASTHRLSSSSQNQALAALQFLYGQVLGIDLGALPAYVRAKVPVRVPNVLEPEDVARVLAQLGGTIRLVAL
jgi:site-specific recombinase XerD